MNIDTATMTATELAFAIAALTGHADISELRNALNALIGATDAYEAVYDAMNIIDANQF